MTKYAIIVERADDGGYGVWSPDLPGCVAVGDSKAEALEEMREAVRLHLELLHERGEPRPTGSAAETFAIDAGTFEYENPIP